MAELMTARGENNQLPGRGFEINEYEGRLLRAQRLMRDNELAVILLTTEPEFRYFSGFLTQFWQSPTRPWFLLLPSDGKPVAVIPEIGAAALSKTWIEDVRTWPSPVPEDDGRTLLSQTLTELAGKSGHIGLPMGLETHLRMPLADYEWLRQQHNGNDFMDATSIIRTLRMRKSEAEIAKIAAICGIVSDIFDAVPRIVSAGSTEREAFRALKLQILENGADDVPYLVGGAGKGGYEDIISPPKERPLQDGDVLMFDTGSVFDGYFCDFDRNYAVGTASDLTRKAHEILYEATEAGIRAAQPGRTCAEIFAEMWQALDKGWGSASATGRLGHGLGMQLTEWPSLAATDETVLHPGMVLTIEPALTIGPGKTMVHEENVVIREGRAQLLTKRAPEEIMTITS